MFLFFNPYGLAISLALLAAFGLTSFRAARRGLDPRWVWDSLPWVALFGLIGARLYHVTNYLSFYIDHLILVPQIWRGGLGIYGALVGGFCGLLLKFKIQKSPDLPAQAGASVRNADQSVGTGIPTLRREKCKMTIQNSKVPYLFTRPLLFRYLDAAAPAIALGQTIGRVGNIFNGENLPYTYWEIITNIFTLVMIFAYEVLSIKSQNSDVESRNQISKFKTNGKIFILYLLSYSVARFFLEFIRRDSPWVAGPLTMAQWVSLGIFFLSLGFWRRAERP